MHEERRESSISSLIWGLAERESLPIRCLGAVSGHLASCHGQMHLHYTDVILIRRLILYICSDGVHFRSGLALNILMAGAKPVHS